MSPRRLPHYLKSYRKRAGLSQDEMAVLLGCESGTKVSRYERFARRPTLETALAYEAVFGVPARELLAGMFEEARQAVAGRAALLAERLQAGKPGRATEAKLELLKRLTAKVEDVSQAA